MTKNGLNDATTEIETIKTWWKRWPHANIGVVTGKKSGFFALDIDPRNGGNYSFEQFEDEYGKLPASVEAETGGGGRHILYQYPGSKTIKNRTNLLPGLDIKGEQGYIVVAPSIHASGRPYEWEASSMPGKVVISEAPDHLFNLINNPKASQSSVLLNSNAILEGHRNSTLTSHAGSMRRNGKEQKEIFANLMEINIARCVPPLDQAEVERISKSVAKYDPANTLLEPIQKLHTLNAKVELPKIDEQIISGLPKILKECCEKFDTKVERAVFLVGALGVLSGCLPNIQGVYHNKVVYPNLFMFVLAIASAGKGILTWCHKLGNSIHHGLRQETKNELRKYFDQLEEVSVNNKQNALKAKIERPPEKMLFFPANSSASGLIELASQNLNGGVIFSTEADTLANILKQDWGNYSDILRSAFHHEPYSFFRRADKEYIELNDPKISVLLSGTPAQLGRMFKSAEDGLFSRFCFYTIPTDCSMAKVFDVAGQDFEEFFANKGEEILKIYRQLSEWSGPLRFSFSTNQQKLFQELFEEWHQKYPSKYGPEIFATIRRLGLVCFRIAMIFSSMRIRKVGQMKNIVCADQDFKIALDLVKIFKDHAIHQFTRLPGTSKRGIESKNERQLLAKELHKNGMSQADIAELLLADRKKKSTINYWLNK